MANMVARFVKLFFILNLVNYSECTSLFLEPLILTPLIKAERTNEARIQSEVDSNQFLDIKSHSGFITVNEKFNSNLFFWYFPHSNISDAPLIIWLPGGPGISSMSALFDMIGPFSVKRGKLSRRQVSWADSYSLLFIDNPVGAGFSFTNSSEGYTTNEEDVGDQLLDFIKQFVQVYPEASSVPVYVAGESYAGKYVPALAVKIHEHNEKGQRLVNLKGVLIGNGLIDPVNTMGYSKLCESLGLLEGRDLDTLKALESTVVRLINKISMVQASNAFNVTIEYIKHKTNVSIYNMIEEPTSSAPELEYFVKRNDIRNAIHVGKTDFNFNNQLVYKKMLPDIMNTTRPWIEELLEHYDVALYWGQLDLVLPYSLGQNAVQKLKWSKKKEYLDAPRKPFLDVNDNKVLGYIKKGGNLSSILIRGAGHMVPKDQPGAMKQVLDAIIMHGKA